MFSRHLVVACTALLSFTCVSALPSSRVEGRRDVKVLAGAPINSLNLTITPDSPVEGQNVTLDWGYGDAGTAPYNVQIGTGGYYANLTWLYEYTSLTETNLTWNVNVAAGETLVFQLWDARNTTTYSQNHLILPSNTTAGDNDADQTTDSGTGQNSAISSEEAHEYENEDQDGDEDEDESFLGELLALIQKELDG
ncbi:uncharacterized protein I303_103560 [Kwoniella dejecticola CBS 10117]|uniref:PKD domain-containing protein n=1 Tax=Kwoniella dejecticola CBS 10117 TaxID=1296121 RepID=A0A1A6A740_9TREE|nr:uncharacterized protein I303_03582 [Kwoniella dejecticola CBS 10117]OBR85868.1 hypothetical protein I303_03582 [Kwoniella dejecticola CBS 10117]